MSEIKIGTGFLPLATEGDFSNTSMLHFPAYIGILKPMSGGAYQLASMKERIFEWVGTGKGDYTLVQGGFGLHSVPTAKSGEIVGVYGTPKVPCNESGLTLAMGIDLGAGFSADSLSELTAYLPNNPKLPKLIAALQEAAGRRGMLAVEIYPKVSATAGNLLPLSPQDTLDLTYAVAKKKEAGFKHPDYWSQLHPTLQQVVLRAYHSSNTRGKAMAEAIGNTSIRQETTPLGQCRAVLNALNASGFDAVYANGSDGKIATLKGLIGYVNALKTAWERDPALKIIVEDRPPQVAELTESSSLTAQLVTQAKQADKLYEAEKEGKLNEDKRRAILQYDYAKDATKSIADAQNKPYYLRVQQRLNALGFTDAKGRKLTEDGVWGSNSADALKKYQAAQQLPATGKLDKTVLQALLANKAPENPQPQVSSTTEDRQAAYEALKARYALAFQQGKGKLDGSVGAKGDNKPDDVRVLRGMLFYWKYLPDDARTVLGDPERYKKMGSSDAALETAIRRFQSEKVGLSNPDGRVDAGGTTWKVLTGLKPANTTTKPLTNEWQVAEIQPNAAVFGCFN